MRRATRDGQFNEFFVANFPGLRRTAYLVVRDWQLAEDLTQQALIKVYVAWARISDDKRLAYARAAVVNESLSYLRRRRPEVSPLSPLSDRAAESGADLVDLSTLFGLLPERQRAIVALRFLDDLPVLEVAQVLGIAEGTVKSQTARALATLRRELPRP